MLLEGAPDRSRSRDTIASLNTGSGRDWGGWRGNSSHVELSSVSTRSVGSHRDRLPAEVVRFVEATCWAELRLLGYPLSLQRAEIADAICDFEEPWRIERDHLRDYGRDHLAAELRRLELLGAEPGDESARYFLFPEVHQRLRGAL